MLEAGIALVIFLLGQLCTLVWMLSSIFTQLKNINDTLEQIKAQSKDFYPNKDGLKLEASVNKLWEKMDACPACHSVNK